MTCHSIRAALGKLGTITYMVTGGMLLIFSTPNSSSVYTTEKKHFIEIKSKSSVKGINTLPRATSNFLFILYQCKFLILHT